MRNVYDTLRWRRVRAQALARDEGHCTCSRLLGGSCGGGTPHVHHLIPVEDGGDPFALENLATVCPSHHPAWESLRRSLVRARAGHDEPPRCTHHHRTAEARRLCESQMARLRSGAAA